MMGQFSETDLEPGDRCYHVREPDAHGTVASIEENRWSVMVAWDDGDGTPSFAWANKVARLAA